MQETGTLWNPASHRSVTYADPQQAAEILAFASLAPSNRRTPPSHWPTPGQLCRHLCVFAACVGSFQHPLYQPCGHPYTERGCTRLLCSPPIASYGFTQITMPTFVIITTKRLATSLTFTLRSKTPRVRQRSSTTWRRLTISSFGLRNFSPPASHHETRDVIPSRPSVSIAVFASTLSSHEHGGGGVPSQSHHSWQSMAPPSSAVS